MKLREVFGIRDKFAKYKADRTKLPIPPKVNLWHATLTHNWPSIQRQGLIPDGVCKLYGACDKGYVYLGDRATTAVEMVSPDQPGINKAELDKSGGKGVLMLIDSTKLDPELLEGDPNLAPNWLNPIFSYRYAGTIPASAIVEHDVFTLEKSYYANKNWRSVSQIKPGADAMNPVD